MKNISLLVITLLLVSCNNSTKEKRALIPEPDANPVLTSAQTIAIKNGLDKWDHVNQLDFTFNVDRGENHYERSWSWQPKNNNVTMMTPTDTITYNRTQMDSTHLGADQAFINDKYWLLAPYHLVWDEGITISEAENKIAPISNDTLNVLTITYGDKGGYTPGDAYDFYFDKSFTIKEWVFRKGNDSLPSLMTTWEDYEDFKGLKIAKTHKDSTGNFKLHFTNITVK